MTRTNDCELLFINDTLLALTKRNWMIISRPYNRALPTAQQTMLICVRVQSLENTFPQLILHNITKCVQRVSFNLPQLALLEKWLRFFRAFHCRRKRERCAWILRSIIALQVYCRINKTWHEKFILRRSTTTDRFTTIGSKRATLWPAFFLYLSLSSRLDNSRLETKLRSFPDNDDLSVHNSALTPRRSVYDRPCRYFRLAMS